MTADAFYWHAAEAHHAADAPEAAGRSRRDRPGAGEDVPTRGEAAEDERGDG